MQTQTLQVKKRDGRVVDYDRARIKQAIKMAFLSHNIQDDQICEILSLQVERIVFSKYDSGNIPNVEGIQDIVEIVLIANNYPLIAKHYILYRAEHKKIREQKVLKEIQEKKLQVKRKDGQLVPFNVEIIREQLEQISFGLNRTSIPTLVENILKTVYNGIPTSEIDTMVLNAVQNKIEEHYQC